MKADNFSSYLNDASLLHDISYQELKSMVVQYPYCQNLRYLLVTKSHMDDKSEFQTDLHLAATYSIDRNFLFKHLYQEAYTQTTTEDLVLDKDPIIDVPKETIVVAAAAPIVKEVLDLTNVSERRTIRIQSENAKLFAEQKAGLSDESVPNANFIEQLEEVDKKIDAQNQEPDVSLETVTDEIEGNDSSDISQETPIENPFDQEIIIEDNSSIEELFEEENPEGNVEAEPMTDRSKLITYIEKPEPKESRSVIDQLMKRNIFQNEDSVEQDEINIEDELESHPNPIIEQGETPTISFNQPVTKEIIFEITNELPGLSKEESLDDVMNSEDETFLETSFEDGDEAPREETDNKEEEDYIPEPIPKTSYEDWKEKFLPDPSEDPPSEISIEAILREEEENQLEAVIEEEIAEEKKKKKSKKDKKKSKNKKENKKEKKKEEGKKKKKKKRKVLDIAKKSVKENEDIISETLAELLAKQGSRKKAIQMYERLSLIFPEKSTFFAEKIEQLKN